MIFNFFQKIHNKIKRLNWFYPSEQKDSFSNTQRKQSETQLKKAKEEFPASFPDNKVPSRRKRSHRRARNTTEGAQQPADVVFTETWDVSDFDVPLADGKLRFHDLHLPSPLMHAIYDLGYKYCTPIQAAILPGTLSGKDATGRAQTGTGKTAAFLISIIATFANLIPPESDKKRFGSPRSLIIAPTRELVMQIVEEARLLSKYCPCNIVGIFGGIDYEKQRKSLKGKPIDILVATPGRLLDFHRQQEVNLSRIEILVIDEADRMLDMGFIPDVRKIISSTPPKANRQTLLFSATLTDEVSRLAMQWTKDPLKVEIEPEQVAVDTVKQIVYLVTTEEKKALLYNIITRLNLERVIVFCNRRDETRHLTELLMRYQVNCNMISGEIDQKKRIKTLEDFRSGKIRVMVATDVAGRGLHIEGVSHVINYTLPTDPEDYVHRIGRTGRAGAAGTSISFACEEDSFYLPDIEVFLGHELRCTHPDESWLTLPPLPKKKEEKPVERQGRNNGRRRQSPRSEDGKSFHRRRRKPKPKPKQTMEAI